MKKSVLGITKIIFIIVAVFFICGSLFENRFERSALEVDPGLIESKSSIFDLEIGNYYKLKHELYANNECTENGADMPVFVIDANEPVLLLELEGKFAKVEYNSNSGWIPAWYLSDEAKNVNLLSPFLLLTKEKAGLYLYPEGDIAYDNTYHIEEGRVIMVMAEYKNWYLANFLRYDCPEYDLLWINKDKTIAYSVDMAKEGYLNENTFLCTKEGIMTDEIIEGYVIITSNEKDLYKVTGAGGQGGYIRKSDFLHFDLNTFSKFLSP